MPNLHFDPTNWIIGQSLVPAVRTATANGSSLDLQEGEGFVLAVCDTGTVSGTAPTLDVTLEESVDDSAFTALTLLVAHVQVTATDDLQIIVSSSRAARHVRAVATIGGTNPSFACMVSLMSRSKSY